MAACVRLLTPSKRSIALAWAFTVPSVMPSSRAICLLYRFSASNKCKHFAFWSYANPGKGHAVQEREVSKRARMTTNRRYVYAIHVNGVVRYFGKGSNGRLHFHVIEARRINSRRALGAKTDRTTTNFYRKLAEAMRHGATITEEIMVDGLTDQEAYRVEKQKIEQLHKQNRGQLWEHD